jgi:hypothetical protein
MSLIGRTFGRDGHIKWMDVQTTLRVGRGEREAGLKRAGSRDS